jgi:hypothetical protein
MFFALVYIALWDLAWDWSLKLGFGMVVLRASITGSIGFEVIV